MKNSLELKDLKAQLKKRALEMIDNCKVEIRKFSDEESQEYTSIKTQITEINEELRKLDESLSSVNTKSINTKTQKIMEKNFSLIKAIRSIANNQKMDELTEAVVNAGAAEMRKSGLNYTGQIQLPSAETRAAITVTTEGEDVVATDILDIVKPLHSKNVMIQAGAKYVTGLVGDIQYPVMSAASCAWEGEVVKAKDGAPTFPSNVKLTPKRLAVVVPISKQFIVQDGIGAENAIREEIINAINAKIEATILGNGAGSLTEPKGFFPTSDSSIKDVTSDFNKVCDLEAELEDVTGELKYIVSPKAKADFRGMAKSAKSTQLVMENGEIDGTPALCTSHLSNKHVILGDFSQYIIAQWGNINCKSVSYRSNSICS